MGEAKRRKANDPFYGKPKRGLVISPPIEIDGSNVFIRSSDLDPQELRYALLFWDKLAWPLNNAIHIESGPDAYFLESAGVLSRPTFTFSGSGAAILARSQVEAWRDLDAKNPGTWSLSQGENSLLVRGQVITDGNGVGVSLFRAIPVPDRDVPLAEILDFKAKRADELVTLREHIDSIASRVATAENQNDELSKQIAELDRRCTEVLKVAKEWPFPIRLTNVKASLDLKPTTTLAAILAGYADPIGLPMVSAVAAGIAASIKLSGDFGLARRTNRVGPYRYVYSFTKDLFP